MNRPNENQTQKIILDLVFTLVIPILILSPNLLGDGISVASLLGSEKTGHIRAYLLAALIPVVYVLWDLVIRRNVSMIALMGGAGALMSGALAFWYVDGFWYAIKDSARSYISAIIFFVSAFTPYPLLRLFIEAAFIGSEDPLQKRALSHVLNDHSVKKGIFVGTMAFVFFDIVGGVVNSIANYRHVVDSFGTEGFNKQIADVNAIMRLPNMAISFIGIGVALYIIHRAVIQRYGKEANLFDLPQLTDALIKKNEIQEEPYQPTSP